MHRVDSQLHLLLPVQLGLVVKECGTRIVELARWHDVREARMQTAAALVDGHEPVLVLALLARSVYEEFVHCSCHAHIGSDASWIPHINV